MSQYQSRHAKSVEQIRKENLIREQNERRTAKRPVRVLYPVKVSYDTLSSNLKAWCMECIAEHKKESESHTAEMQSGGVGALNCDRCGALNQAFKPQGEK